MFFYLLRRLVLDMPAKYFGLRDAGGIVMAYVSGVSVVPQVQGGLSQLSAAILLSHSER